MGIERTIEINAPPEKVWEMLAFDRNAEWMEEIESAEYSSVVRTPEDKYGVGATGHFLDKHSRLKYVFEITESLEYEKISSRWRGTGWVRNMIVTYTLKPTESGTEMTFAVDYEEPNLIRRIMLNLLVYLVGEKEIERSLEKLKSILEK